jgi:hypothetical protein
VTTHEYLLQKYGTTLSFQQAAQEIGLHWQTIRVMCLRGDIETARAGRKWILTTKALAEYLDSSRKKGEIVAQPRVLTPNGHRKIV